MIQAIRELINAVDDKRERRISGNHSMIRKGNEVRFYYKDELICTASYCDMRFKAYPKCGIIKGVNNYYHYNKVKQNYIEYFGKKRGFAQRH